jgi:hypothetical protein
MHRISGPSLQSRACPEHTRSGVTATGLLVHIVELSPLTTA